MIFFLIAKIQFFSASAKASVETFLWMLNISSVHELKKETFTAVDNPEDNRYVCGLTLRS